MGPSSGFGTGTTGTEQIRASYVNTYQLTSKLPRIKHGEERSENIHSYGNTFPLVRKGEYFNVKKETSMRDCFAHEPELPGLLAFQQ